MGQFDAIAEAYRQWSDRGLAEPEAMAAATSIVRAHQLVTRAIERALRPLGLTFARYEVLMLLSFSRSGALPMTKIGDRLMVHPTGISKLVDKLEAEGLVARVPNAADRRGTLATITPAGRGLAGRATTAVGAVRFGVDLPDGDLGTIVEVMRRLRHANDDL